VNRKDFRPLSERQYIVAGYLKILI
jgi:hypothetical protein